MPELPEVETVCRGLRPLLEGRRIAAVEVRRHDLRRPVPADLAHRLEGRRIEAVRRRAKYGLVALSGGSTLLFHLGMSGRFRHVRAGANDTAPAAHDHVVLETDAGDRVVFNDARRFGLLVLADSAMLDAHPLLRDLGPEPLDDAFTPGYLRRALAHRRTSLKAALMDQRLVAGLGNIYVAEALHRARLSPRRGTHSIGPARAARLVAAIRAVLEEAIAAGGSSLRDHARVDGGLGYFQHRFRVYDRAGAPCPRADCGGTIQRLVQAGRSTFWCAGCQR
ncbi:MAG: bifunctional DNA-formamidopyrimidine glycosylase/DNA-(apurinic or apyrimidinic site) lyase [Alphaproteobacteria bacterium]|nr:MAG: bifunctional DNA-formamidopyrimidine glycosylase/DNA-(apurinic or apyrimidinic site) lyase [Alphaproteobacteria bacterium]